MRGSQGVNNVTKVTKRRGLYLFLPSFVVFVVFVVFCLSIGRRGGLSPSAAADSGSQRFFVLSHTLIPEIPRHLTEKVRPRRAFHPGNRRSADTCPVRRANIGSTAPSCRHRYRGPRRDAVLWRNTQFPRRRGGWRVRLAGRSAVCFYSCQPFAGRRVFSPNARSTEASCSLAGRHSLRKKSKVA